VPNRLADAVSPYLRSHADNPVDWRQWGSEAFADAAARDVPVLVSIGYSTCHWCHVMARESFSDPDLAAHLNENFVAIKVDREEYPDVDATYLAAASAFTQNLGWPLNVFVTPGGRAFFAGTYWPPAPMQGHPAFRQILDAVLDAWRHRRADVEQNADLIVRALADGAGQARGELPAEEDWSSVVASLVENEDREYGGFGGAPKFPVGPVQLLLLDRGASGGADAADAAALATRVLAAMAASDLRDPVEGGFFRYSTMRDWTDPHYERMLYDNALLLEAYARVPGAEGIAEGIAGFLGSVMRVEGGGFASAQDSESTVDGVRVEGGYYRLDAAARARQSPPALDEKVLTGWNGLAIRALARAARRHGRADWLDLARAAADHLLERHLRDDGTLLRASIGARLSPAVATLEDYGMLATGLLEVALASGDVAYARVARRLVDAALAAGSERGSGVDPGLGAGAVGSADAEPVKPRSGDDLGTPAGPTAQPVFAVPGGADPVLEAHGLALAGDPSEGAYPSGTSAMAEAAHTLYLLTADRRYEDAAASAVAPVAALAIRQPVSFGAALSVMVAVQAAATQLVVVVPDGGVPAGGPEDAPSVLSVARLYSHAGAVTAIVTDSQAAAFAAEGFELFEGRSARQGAPTAYLCRDFVCRMPVTTADALEQDLHAS